MWSGAAFNLTVIRTFGGATRGLRVSALPNFAESMSLFRIHGLTIAGLCHSLRARSSLICLAGGLDSSSSTYSWNMSYANLINVSSTVLSAF
jgi:hypothetical protein